MSKTKTYEAMFLVDSGKDFQTASAPINTILARSEAEVLSMKPWDDRRLAFEIKGRKRGLYILTYFKVDPLKVTEIEHDCQLSEEILRALILTGDDLTPEQINAETPATGGHKPDAPRAEGEGPRDEDMDFDRDRDYRDRDRD
ncbi:MAG: 30S ribosomal protein S6 [Planctomycetaceae bacterium]|nr:30S ribosomal protein S6 [Planctomycetaceae bacterium]